MLIRYEADVDVAYISLAGHIGPGGCDAPGITGLVPPGHDQIGEINLDFDRSGRLLGVEVVGAKRLLPAEALASAEIVGDQRGGREEA
ncbi:DUF2283 domain-containing protein [Pseudonocardia sp. HH130630-07]|uniref:DUF2283 domain-containing protein n=1 Tax=Pseudonocardia sp. HH130630-07 TaxID=1690815 RepID=UPI000839BFBE|nr:DUF2283 domain-containing protein [Pseudonocardia sp. HH130630-07]